MNKKLIIAIITPLLFLGAYYYSNAAIVKVDETKPAIKISSLQKGLVGHWTLDKESLQSATTFADKTPYENVGTKKGSILKFDGTDDYVDCGNDESLNITDEITISAWVKIPSTTTFEQEICGKWGVNGGTANYGAYVIGLKSTNQLFFKIDDVINGSGIWESASFPVDNWQHVAATFNGSNAYLYRNASQVASWSGSGVIPTSGNNVIIGNIAGFSLFFNGAIDEVRIYNRALSAAEITTLYQGGTVSETGLVAHYKMKDKSGATLTDETGVNNGTLTNFVDTTAGYGDTHDSGWATLNTPNVFNLDRMGQVNRAMSFDGVDDYVDCGNDESLNITDEITVSVWVKSPVAHDGRIVYKYEAGQGYYLTISPTTGVARGVVFGDTTVEITGTTNLADSNWHHVVFTRKIGGNLNLYVDGVSDVAPVSSPTGTLENEATLYIGQDVAYAHHFNGAIDEVRIYNRALSEEEITSLYESYRPKIIISD